ncbi:MAG: hypothetical protein KatS3mg089_0348 [Patescibacteria group bacterium]|nr:MAG: hypothetical protein KatS3mg089_0348 [Patescibacteria group bacterium]
MDDINSQESKSENTSDIQSSVATEPLVGDAAVLLNLEELIRNHIQSLDKLKEEHKKLKEMFEDAFANNPVYRENAEKAKEAEKIKATTRQQIASQPSVINLANKIKEFSLEIKERQAALSDYLLEYQRLTGSNEIEDANGQILEIVNSAKLVRRSAKK